jgi:hypothetical protein
MPKKPVQDPKETAKAREEEKSTEKKSTSFLKIDRSLRPSGFHCDELNNGAYDTYDPKE